MERFSRNCHWEASGKFFQKSCFKVLFWKEKPNLSRKLKAFLGYQFWIYFPEISKERVKVEMGLFWVK